MTLEDLGFCEIELDEVEVPLLGVVQAGQPIEAVAESRTVSIPQDMLGRYRTFALEVKGDSMIEENIRPGDVIVVEERHTAENGQTVVALINESDVTLKKFYLESDCIRLEPANPTMEPIVLRHDQVRVLGVVAGLIRHYRRH
ncbi:MAG: transcriptional repressor LexA [Desulfarculaceae bacterium]|nr:transcriptional repressor LexA [Desulfarculaceae bacterium]MCF8049102.1 transcriptional repressor LexA [Desulfarculaceae bacterium]MCF8066725.1 transcriptional repressor LexA [Desulfarculaceae bacterium]MCF8099438.1 transcriptional repressor LexA [Desulfarculaceae bacterium]MCF8122785.1 transcriptional repressor LexA [Desulfarculaceae bacterium]